jgi:periplasmic divalent cation tolerance protein
MPTVYVTAPRDAGQEIARAVVDAELAACVNAVACTSTYRWPADGGADAIHEDDELILFAKTSDARVDALVDEIEALHPYDVPCIEVFAETDVRDAYGEWVDAATTPAE